MGSPSGEPNSCHRMRSGRVRRPSHKRRGRGFGSSVVTATCCLPSVGFPALCFCTDLHGRLIVLMSKQEEGWEKPRKREGWLPLSTLEMRRCAEQSQYKF